MSPELLDDRSPEAERARLAVASLETPPADRAFRSALKASFANGAIEATAEQRPRTVATRRVSWWRPPVLTWAAAPLAMAALAIALVLGDRGPRWEVVAASGTGIAIVDDRPVPMNHLDDLRLRVHAGSRIRVPEDGTLEIASRGNLALHVAPGTDMTVPGSPGRWFQRAVRGAIRSGEMRITSGSRFHGASLTIASPETQVLVTGTTLAVIREPQGTCVCVLEGTVRVGNEGAMVEVPRGERRFVFNDGRPPETAAIRETEIAPLGAFHEKCAALLRR